MLRLNVWLSAKGVYDNQLHYPYTAQSPITFNQIEIHTREDLEEELINIYEKDGGGEPLYLQSLLVGNPIEIIDQKAQMKIEQYKFMKTFNSAPDVRAVSATFAREMIAIDDEIKRLR